jgi:hypothetical protein
MDNAIVLAQSLYEASPLNKQNQLEYLTEKIKSLSVRERLDLLVYSFMHYDRNYNYELCLFIPLLWIDFKIDDWKKLFEKMFPRKIKYVENNLKEINTGSYFDILLLNGIIGVSPFEFIFKELKIDFEEKREFYNYLKHYGEYAFYINERELIENIVHFYNLDVFKIIVNVKEELLNQGFEPAMNYRNILARYSLE